MSMPQGMLSCCRFQKTFSSLHKILVVHCCCERGRNHLVCGSKGIINSAIDQTKNGDFYLNGLPLLQTELPAVYSSALFQQFCNLFGKVCFAVSETEWLWGGRINSKAPQLKECGALFYS